MSELDNNLFFLCSLIELLGRITNNKKEDIVNYLGREKLKKIYDLAEVYHSEDINNVADDLINENNIPNGNYNIFNNIKNSNPPTYWDMGKVYQRLIKGISASDDDYFDNLMKVMTSWIIEKFDNYDSSLYFESPSYLLECLKNGKIL